MAKKKDAGSNIDARHWILVSVLVAFAATNALWYTAYTQVYDTNVEQSKAIYELQEIVRAN